MIRSLRVRLSLAIVVLLTLVLGTFSLGLYVAVSRALWDMFDARMADETQALANMVDAHNSGHWEFQYRRLPDFEGSDAAYFQIWSNDGVVLARSPELGTRDLPKTQEIVTSPIGSMIRLPDGRSGRAIQSSLFVQQHGEAWPNTNSDTQPRVTVLIARGTADIDATLAQLRMWLWGLGAIVLLAATTAAVFTVSRNLRPVAHLSTAIAGMDERDLGKAITIAALPMELEPPVAKLNELLRRLAESFARERRFTADVSHELRTPLAGVRAVLEVAASRDRPAADYRRAIDEATDVVRQMHAMVENLLMLARIEGHQMQVSHESIPLRDLVDDVWARCAVQAAERRLTFCNEVAAQACAMSDRDGLRVVLSNLLSNALEYTCEGGRIAVRSAARGFPLDVCDSGPPIPDAMLPRIFDRFFRADAARTDGVHCGIGLALAQAMSANLGLSLTANNQLDGSVIFRLAVERG